MARFSIKALPLLLSAASVVAAPDALAADSPSAPANQPRIAAVPAVITLEQPRIKGLISVDEQMDPFDLDADIKQTLSLQEALRSAVNHNLDIGIATTQEKTQKWNYVSSLGKFLPNVTSGYSLYGLDGKIALPFALGSSGSTALSLPSHFNVLSAGFSQNLYQGGSILFGALRSKHLLRAQRAQTHYTVSDALLAVTRDYYNLLLNEALLEVRMRAVDTSTEQVRINTDLATHGLATNLDLLQSETQLSRDRQQLIQQQIARREAAIRLATTLNANYGIDILPDDRTLRKVRLISAETRIRDLLRLAMDNRPEIKQSEELRLAARDAIVVAAAPLQPSVKFNGSAYGLGENLGNLTSLGLLSLTANWNIHGLGVTDTAETQAARWQARQTLLQQNKTVQTVASQVRNSLLQSLQSEKQIDETTNEVASAQEELRLAKLRFEHGLGNNIDVITAQRDLTTALVDQAQSVMDFNIAQAQLLHDIGLISINSLTSGTVIR